MTQKIEELGGLPRGEIYLAIAQSEEKIGAILEQKINQHQVAMELRLTAQDAAIQANVEKVMEVKMDVAALLKGDEYQSNLLEKLVNSGDTWHQDDLAFRHNVITRVSAIEAEQQKLSSR